jgi:predicted ATPase
VAKDRLPAFLDLFRSSGVDATMTGRTLDVPRFRILDGGRTLIDAAMDELAAAHRAGLAPWVE